MKRLVLVISLFSVSIASAQTAQWTAGTASDWYARQPWIIGANYIQSNTVNQIEMWQPRPSTATASTWNWGGRNVWESIPCASLCRRPLWEHDSGGMQSRMGKLLKIAEKHKMKVIFVLFDSSGDPYPEWAISANPSREFATPFGCRARERRGSPIPNRSKKPSAMRKTWWRLSPSTSACWPGTSGTSPTTSMRPATPIPSCPTSWKRPRLLPKVFQYVRAGVPTQPVTSGLWKGDWSSEAALSPIEKIQIEKSDFISFQNYDGPQEFEKRVKWLQAFQRPVVCTGFLARNQGSSIEAILPIALKYDIGALVGDLVQGKTQRWLPWDSWQKPYVDREPPVWSQDLFLTTGPLYRKQDADVIRQMIASAPKPVSSKPNSKKSGK
jgi:hypothetical protein